MRTGRLIQPLSLRTGVIARMAPLALILLLLLATSASKLNQSWLVPGGKIHIDNAALKGEAGRVCALTFDDGPEAEYTAKICSILDKYEIKATFFCVGRNVAAYPSVVKQLVASGHEIGNHTYSHPVSTKLSIAKLKQQLEKTNAALAEFGVTPRWFRPPYGEISAADVKAASSLGLQTVLWSVDPRDWAQPGVDTIVSRVLGGATPGAVILLHCTHAQTVAALPRIIEGLRDKGYTFVTMSQWEQVVTGQATLPLPAAKPAETPAAPPELQPTDKGLEADLGLPGAAMEPPDDAMAPGFYQAFGEDEPRADAAPAAQLAQRGEVLKVFANFLGADGVLDVFRHGKAEKLQLFADVSIALRAPDKSRGTAVTDEPVVAAEELPTLPAGEEYVSTPSAGILIPAPPVLPAVGGAASQPRPLEQRQPLPLRSVDLSDIHDAATAWAPPATINTDNFLNAARQTAPGGLYPQAKFYYLCLADDLEQTTWTKLDSYVRLAKLSGLVLPSGKGVSPPDCLMSCPGAYVRLDSIDQGARIDLAVESVADVLDLLGRQKENVFVVIQPSNLHVFIAAHTWAEMNDKLRDFVLFRQMTAGLDYDPARALAESWKLPAGVQLGRFTDGKRVVLLLYSQNYGQSEVAVPPEFAYYSRASIDAGDYLKVAPLDGGSVVVGKSPVVLYWENPQ